MKESTYISSYPIPNNRDSAYIMLLLAMNTAKRSIPKLNTVNYLPKQDEETMLNAGEGVMNGKLEPSQYVNRFFSIIKRITKLKVLPEESLMRSQIEVRVRGNQSGLFNKNMKEGFKTKTNKEKQLTIALLAEKLKNLTGKQVILVEEEETFFVPQDLEGRQEKYLQSIYRLLQQEVIDGDLELKDLPIKNLGKVKRVNGNVTINKCYNLENLGYLDYVQGDFNCNVNGLTTLQGSAKIIGGSFYCYNNRLSTLEGGPREVGGSFWCGDNFKQFTKEEVRAVCNVKGNIYC